MKIILINPPYFEVYKGYEKAARIGVCYPPIGLLYIASKLISEGHEVKMIDVGVENLNFDKINQNIKKFAADLVGISATTPLFRKACDIAKSIKSQIDIPIVIGGFHVTILGDEVLKRYPEFDYACIGEGEITFSELVNCIKKGNDPMSVKGILIRKGNDIISTQQRPLLDNLDELPFPARHIIDKNNYLWTPPNKKEAPVATIITKRGCPFMCKFCSQHSMFSRRVRYRSVNNVLDELEEIVNKHGVKHIINLDDTLIIKRERMMQICEGIHQRKLKFTWEGMARANLVDKEVIETMARTGLVRMSFGIESGDERILKIINKGVTTQQIRQAYAWAKGAGIETRGSAIIGHPGETSKSAWKTIRFLRGLKHLDQVYLNIMVPYPGTEVFELAKKGEYGYRLLSEDYENYVRYNDSVLEVNDLDQKKLRMIQNVGLWIFYLTPRRVYYNLQRAGLKNGFRMALAMLRGLVKLGR